MMTTKNLRTCGAQGVSNWDATDRCGARAKMVMFWAGGHAVSVCEDCAADIRCAGDDATPGIGWSRLPSSMPWREIAETVRA